ncbi:isopenicillin N synthase family oxygenase [Acidovorax sp. SUPP1855]|nr:isopenicillin N synthase family oxygenase [Acidovorax sp. SUPP1855]
MQQSTANLPAISPADPADATADVRGELEKEARMGGMGAETSAREIRRIDLSDFEHRKAEIAEQLWSASVEIGFFQVTGHGIAVEDIRNAFARAEAFFDLPRETKAQWPLARNAGWEHKAQVRPSTRTPDQKESYQVTRPRMAGLWPSEAELPGFQEATLRFEAQCWHMGMQLLSCFADRLGFDPDFFTRAHDPSSAAYQSTLRMLHYFAVDPALKDELGLWRAGAHTDFDCLTLLFQRPGQGGLQVLPGKEMESRQWTSVEPAEGVITCNIGDMLTRWSDDQLPSNFHRVRNPLPHEYQGARYSLAFFCQANEDAVVEGPGRKYPPITAGDYLRQRITANFAKY